MFSWSSTTAMHATRAASEEDDNCADQRADSRNKNSPGSRAVVGTGASAVVVDVGPDDAKQDKVDDHSDGRDQEGKQSHQGSEE